MSDLRTRSSSSKQAVEPSSPAPGKAKSTPPPKTPREPKPRSLTRRAVWQTLTTTANLANLLPTGTLLAFQLLTPVFTNNGSCDSATRPLTLFLVALLTISCFLACFTDSVKASDGRVYYGFATLRGLWLFDYGYLDGEPGKLPDLTKYRLRIVDWLHALLSMLVFGAVALRDKNVVQCFYPEPEHKTKEVLDIVPVGVGVMCSLLFMVFPSRRHGIGRPVTPDKY